MKDIGINKNRMGANVALVLIFICSIILCSIMWGGYKANYYNEYFINNGVERERWARSWFTHKDAKYLHEKKTIKVVPYKNTYGILE